MMNLPLVERISLPPDGPLLYERLRCLPFSFLLDSSLLVPGLGRYSFLGTDPFLIFRSKGSFLEVERDGKVDKLRGHPLQKLKELLNEYKISPSELPFCGGAVGYFSYDLGRMLERLPVLAVDDLRVLDLCLGFYDIVVMIDGVTGEVYIISTGFPEKETGQAVRRAQRRLREMKDILALKKQPLTPVLYKIPGITSAGDEMFSHFDEESYCRIVEQAKEYIAAGDIYQVNLSQRFSLAQRVEPWLLYCSLRSINPAPMAAFLDFGDLQVVSASPERFLKVTGSQVETRPIKGTRPRGQNPVEDQRLRDELWNSEKDRAELVMIVDLERNDLGRICRTGSVRVPELYRLEEYATVFHLVSTVVGELPPDKGVVDLLEVAFPGGSITGAPKIRAMEIIEELEPVRRGIYTGSIGYISFNGNADLNIVIRTIIVQGGQVYFQVGGGITSDSDPRLEYLETLDKARALVDALGSDVTSALTHNSVRLFR